MEIKELIERQLKNIREGQRIRCPHCNHVQSNDDCQYPVSYWGQDGLQDWDCDAEECGKKFLVREKVSRSYETELT